MVGQAEEGQPGTAAAVQLTHGGKGQAGVGGGEGWEEEVGVGRGQAPSLCNAYTWKCMYSKMTPPCSFRC